MSGALENNVRALEAAGGDAASPDLIRTARIGVWLGAPAAVADGSPPGLPPGPAGTTAEALGEILGRFWRSIDAEGAGAGALAASARSASGACAAGSDVRRRWDPPYDFAIGVGAAAPPGCATDSVSVGAGGWTVAAGSAAAPGGGANPASALAAAALAAAEALKSVFSIGERRGAARLPDPYEWSAWPAATAPLAPAADAKLDLGEVHVFGVGAVTHALLWLLRRWPGGVSGRLHLVDPDCYDGGNPQRYLGTSAGDLGRPKASSMAGRMRRACPGLDVTAHDTDMNGYFAASNPECLVRTAVCGLDTVEGRRQLGLKLPRTAVNMWTSEFHAGASTFSLDDDGWPCIQCAYPEPAPGRAPNGEIPSIHRELGLAPHRVRELLDSGRSIGRQDAEIISAATGVDVGAIVLRPVRGVRSDMCATGRIAATGPQGGEGGTHVPLAFASAMAGVAGLVELAHAALGAARRRPPQQFQTSVLKYPTPHSWTPRARNRSCPACTDQVRRLARAKYARRPAEEAAAP